jgi:hypothetical protein
MTEPPHPPPLFSGEVSSVPRVPALHWITRNRHFTVPPLLLPVVLMAGLVLAWRRLSEATWIASGVAVAFVWAGAHLKWDRKAEQWYARISALCLAGWLSVAAAAGVSLVLACIAAGVITVWGGFWFWHKRPRARLGDAALITEWDTWWRYHSPGWGLHGSKVTGVLTKAGMETIEVQLWKGRQHHGHVRDIIHLIASGLGGYVKPGQVRVDEHPDDPSKVLLRLKRSDPLRHAQTWHLGLAVQSILEPVAIGFTEAGELILVSLLFNWFVIGESRSGKSNELSNFLGAITGCDDARAWLIDRKGGRAARPWMAAIDWCATTADEIHLMLQAAVAEIKAREQDADTGEEQLVPTPECPALFITVDETYEVTSVAAGEARNVALMSIIASQGQGVAVYLVIVTQHGSLDESVRSEQIRSNLPNRMCFRVAEQRHGAFAIPEYAKLDASKLAQKGAFYMKLGPDTAPAPARGFEFGHPLVREVSRRNGAMPRRPLRLYAADWQETYDQRWSRLPQPFWRDAPQTIDLSPAPARPATTEVPVNGHSPDALAMAQQIEDEIGPGTTIESEFTMPSDAELRTAMERNKARLARALMSAPPEGISPKQLIDATGMSRPWITSQLRALADRGAVLKPADGRYVAAPETDIWAVMQEIVQASARLLEEARSA